VYLGAIEAFADTEGFSPIHAAAQESQVAIRLPVRAGTHVDAHSALADNATHHS
jgi:hypothetical protein